MAAVVSDIPDAGYPCEVWSGPSFMAATVPALSVRMAGIRPTCVNGQPGTKSFQELTYEDRQSCVGAHLGTLIDH